MQSAPEAWAPWLALPPDLDFLIMKAGSFLWIAPGCAGPVRFQQNLFPVAQREAGMTLLNVRLLVSLVHSERMIAACHEHALTIGGQELL